MNIGQIDEKQIISSELSSLVKNDYDVELSVFSESDSEKYDPKNKAKAARPLQASNTNRIDIVFILLKLV